MLAGKETLLAAVPPEVAANLPVAVAVVVRPTVVAVALVVALPKRVLEGHCEGVGGRGVGAATEGVRGDGQLCPGPTCDGLGLGAGGQARRSRSDDRRAGLGIAVEEAGGRVASWDADRGHGRPARDGGGASWMPEGARREVDGRRRRGGVAVDVLLLDCDRARVALFDAAPDLVVVVKISCPAVPGVMVSPPVWLTSDPWQLQ